MSKYRKLAEVARIPTPGDNVAVAIRRLEAHTPVEYEGQRFLLSSTVLEGHRFAVCPIRRGESLLSWGLPFGAALRDMAPGDYACTNRILEVLKSRRVAGEFPLLPSFRNADLQAYELDESSFVPGKQVEPYPNVRTFLGYPRSGNRGTGTRNHIVLLGTSSETSSYVNTLAERLRPLAGRYENVDGVVAVAHTEGGTHTPPNNREVLLRTLSGFMVNPNVGAVLAVDHGDEAVSNRHLEAYAREHGYPLNDVPHSFLSLDRDFDSCLEAGEAIVREWLNDLDAQSRVERPLSEIKVALQCGGSDAFSGISGNPLAGWVAREIVRYGGSANHAETDELIGAERYMLRNVRDLETAERFLGTIESFKQMLAWHGQTAEGNPSGGNLFRGLYNITLKSLGAAMKRDPDVRLDYVIDYAERMTKPGFHFMNSPGNDLESVAGQVASGCNVIFFVTGNGSVTNFPFVPTLKVITTTGRYELLPHEMDVNAGAYLDGESMDDLGRRMLDLTVEAASGRRTKGELAGHSQVSIWRNWAQTDASNLESLESAPEPAGDPLPVSFPAPKRRPEYRAIRTANGYATDRVGLILPTSLCSSQIARMIAMHLNEQEVGHGKVRRFVALPHTEGCGVALGGSVDLYDRTMLDYLVHPNVREAVLLEHGCEKTHNDYMRNRLQEMGIDPDAFGWASVQLDGGIAMASGKVEGWFTSHLEDAREEPTETVGVESLRVALASVGPVADDDARALAELTHSLAGAGATVILPGNSSFLSSEVYRWSVLGETEPYSTIGYGQSPTIPGLHVMECPTEHWVETLTGLGATGAEMVLVHTSRHSLQSHPFVPVVQVSSNPETIERAGRDLDLALEGDASGWSDSMLSLAMSVASREYTPKLHQRGNTDFQITRGLLGVST